MPDYPIYTRQELEDLKIPEEVIFEILDLRTTVAIMNRAIKKLSATYLKDAPRGSLPLESYFELILAKTKKIGREIAMSEISTATAKQHLERMTQNSIKDAVYIPVLIRRAHRKEKSLKRYRAIALRGPASKSNPAETPEGAYQELRGLLEDILTRGIDSLIGLKKDLMVEYDAAKFLKEDIVSGFRVIVKVSEVSNQEEEKP